MSLGFLVLLLFICVIFIEVLFFSGFQFFCVEIWVFYSVFFTGLFQGWVYCCSVRYFGIFREMFVFMYEKVVRGVSGGGGIMQIAGGCLINDDVSKQESFIFNEVEFMFDNGKVLLFFLLYCTVRFLLVFGLLGVLFIDVVFCFFVLEILVFLSVGIVIWVFVVFLGFFLQQVFYKYWLR